MGILYLLPNLLDEELSHEPFLPSSVAEVVASLNGLIAESEKGARRYLRRFISHEKMAAMPICLLNEHTKNSEMNQLLDPVVKGEKWGIVSDAGLPCLADPGAPLVRLAHERKLTVIALPGPSSIIMALQLSGLSGQQFAFHGYLPREMTDLQQYLQFIEKRSIQEDSTQIWIEAPYRSAKMFQVALDTLQITTSFCVALSLTTGRQRVHTKTIKEWKKEPFLIEKEPAVFLINKTH